MSANTAFNIFARSVVRSRSIPFEIQADSKETIAAKARDAKDVVFYEVTLSVDETYLITGNIKHFPVKPFIVTPAQMIEILLSGEIETT